MRKQVNIQTYQKIKYFFIEHPTEEFTQTYMRDTLNLDYYSVKLVLDLLVTEGVIVQIKSRYRRK